MTRRVLFAAAAVALALAIALPRTALAQTDATYKAKREQLSKELAKTEKALADVKGQRAQVQARLEHLIAQAMQERAQTLLLTNEQTALQQLDALLATSQTNLRPSVTDSLASAPRSGEGRGHTRRAASRRLVAGADGAVRHRLGRQRAERPAHVLRTGQWRAGARRGG